MHSETSRSCTCLSDQEIFRHLAERQTCRERTVPHSEPTPPRGRTYNHKTVVQRTYSCIGNYADIQGALKMQVWKMQVCTYTYRDNLWKLQWNC